jgi:hypothetical protein
MIFRSIARSARRDQACQGRNFDIDRPITFC